MKTYDPNSAPLTRRHALTLLGAAATLVGTGAKAATGSIITDITANAACVLIPREIEGPYPLYRDIAGASVLTRQNITEGRPGVPLNLALRIINVNNACTPITNALVYVWQTDKDGLYSGYRQPGGNTIGQTFCRGVQPTDSQGVARFTSIYPGWYPGRITHIHFNVYLGLTKFVTSQLAFQPAVTTAVYRSALYAARGQNYTVRGFYDDMVFADGVQYQLTTTTRNPTTGGYDASLTVGISA